MKDELEKAIRDHIHDGNYAQRVNLFDIFGNIETLSAAPTGAPSDIYGQFKIYDGALYYYNFLTNAWSVPYILQAGSIPSTAPTHNIVDQLRIYNGNLYFYDFTAAAWFSTSGALFDHYTNVGNVTTGETDLYTDTLVASTLRYDGDKLEVEYGGVFVSSGTATREIKVYFGGTVIFDVGPILLSQSSSWTCSVKIIRVSATVIRYMVTFETEGAPLATYTAVGEVTGLTLSSTNILKITGQAAGVGAATNDIVAKMGFIRKISTAS